MIQLSLSPETEAYIAQRVREGVFASASEFVEAAARRQMQEETWFESRVVEGLKGTATPLSSEELQSVRDIVRKARG